MFDVHADVVPLKDKVAASGRPGRVSSKDTGVIIHVPLNVEPD